ncbi:hypothetical protein Leryth_025069 [Lithospermum erythrorhizon]|nr:hypothetical protein Leryth_025069 [Lithospermum erythrorhizon]
MVHIVQWRQRQKDYFAANASDGRKHDLYSRWEAMNGSLDRACYDNRRSADSCWIPPCYKIQTYGNTIPTCLWQCHQAL